MTTPPTRPEPFDPRDYPDPLAVDERVPVHRIEPRPPTRPNPTKSQMVGCIVPVLATLFALMSIATPRSAVIPTSSPPGNADARPGSARPSVPVTATSGSPLSGAPLEPALVPAADSGDVRAVGAPRPATPAPVPPASLVTFSGSLAYAAPSYGRLYLALPEPRGTVATICGPADCVTRRSTDYGPDQRQHPERIADLSAADFERVCGVNAVQRRIIGRCPGTVTLTGRLPATDQ